MFRTILLPLVIASMLVVLFLQVVLRSRLGEKRLCTITEAILRDVSGQPIYIGQCDVDPLGTHVTLRKVAVGSVSNPIFKADRISAGVDQRGFLEGRVRIDQVEVINPQVALDLSHPAPAAAPTVSLHRPTGAACLPDLGRFELGRAKITGGELHVLLTNGRRIAATGLGAELRGAGERLQLALELQGGTYTDATGVSHIDTAVVRGKFDVNEGSAELDTVHVAAPEGTVDVNGSLSSICDLRGAVNADVHADLGALHKHLLSSVDHLGGKAALRVAATFDGTRFRTVGEASVQRLTILDFVPGDFQARFQATPHEVDLSELDLPLESGHVLAKGTVKLARPFAITADADLHNVVLGELLEKLGTRDLPVHLGATGRAHLSGSLAGPKGMDMGIELQTAVNEFGVYDRGFRRRRDRDASRYVGFKHGQVNAVLRLVDTGLVVSHASVEAGETQIDVDGRIGFDPKEGLHLDFDSHHIRLDELGPFGPAVCEGTGTSKGTIRGPYSALVIDSDLDVQGTRVQGFDAGDVTTHVHLDLGEDLLVTSDVHGQRGNSEFTGDGELSFKGEPTIRARVWLDGAHAIDLIGAAMDKIPSLRKLAGNMDGLVTGDVELSGPVSQINIDSRLSLLDVNIFGQHFDTATIRSSLDDGDTLQLDSLVLTRGDARVSARGSMSIADSSFHADVATRGLQISQIDLLADRVPGSTGEVQLNIAATGTLSQPSASGRLIIHNWRQGDQPLATVDLRLGLRDMVVSVDGAITSPWSGDKPEPPRPPGGSWPVPINSMFDAVHATLALENHQNFRVQMKVDLPDAHTELKPTQLVGLESALSGTVDVSGRLDNLNDTRGTLTITSFWLSGKETRIETTQPAILVYEGQRITLKPVTLRGGENLQLEASGTRDPEGNLAFSARGVLDLALLRKLDPDVYETASGSIQIDLGLNGTMSAPSFVGSAQFQDVNIAIEDLPFTLSQGNGGVTFARQAVLLDGFNGEINGGPVSVTGEMELEPGLVPGNLKLNVQLSTVPVRYEDIALTISGSPEITGNVGEKHLRLGGRMVVDRFHYTTDLDLQKQVTEWLEYMRRPRSPRVLSRSKVAIDFDVPIHLGDVRIDNNIAKATVVGDLRLAGNLKHWGLLGTVTVNDAKAYIRNTEFNVSSAVVNFTDANSLKLNFDVRADAHVRDYDVHVVATGTPQEPHLAMSSQPVLSESDIVTLLTIGMVSRDFSNQAFGSLLADAAYNASGIPDQMRRLLPKNDLLRDPTLKVTSDYNPNTSNVEPYAVLETKVLRDDLRLRGETSLISSRGRSAGLELQLRKDVKIGAEWDDDISARSYGDIGGDIHFHWEAP